MGTNIKYKKTLLILFSIFSFVMCKNIKNVKNDALIISFDTLYSEVIKKSVIENCFINPNPLIKHGINKEKSNSKMSESLSAHYYYFNNSFDYFWADTSIQFSDSEIHNFLKLNKNQKNIPKFNLKNESQFILADTFKNISIDQVQYFTQKLLTKDKYFNGFIIFSTPIFRNLNDGIGEYFIRVRKEIDSPRICFLKLQVKDKKVINIEKLLFKERLIFR